MKSLSSRFALVRAAVVAVLIAPLASFAQAAGENPMVGLLNGISLTEIAVVVLALAAVIITIALTFKGPDVAKRVIRKV